jgi:polyvinyl alcohol dehydrogenase (cytochrome)
LDCHPYYGLSAPATVAGDVVFVGGLAGMYRAFDTATGKLLWETNTNISFDGINGIKGHGGAIDSNGSIISNGRVFIQSGYSMHRQLPGNMLLQFTVDGK